MVDFFKNIWEKLKKTVEVELEDLSYMEIITATSENVGGHIDNNGWDILDSLRRGKPPSEYGQARDAEMEITKEDMLDLSNTEILARTRIELDGDVINIIKGNKGEPIKLKESAMELHKLGINVSVQNWESFLRFVLEMTSTLGAIVQGSNVSAFRKSTKT